MKYGFVIPVYRHGATVENVVQSLVRSGVPVILVDDGNDEENRRLIAACADAHKEVSLVVREKNGGKGSAMIDGMLRAHELGLTHVFQLDADGQHDVSMCQSFIAEAENHPDDVICGCPIYDSSVPAARKNGREFSNMWARIVSLNGELKDVLCGFRMYPVEPCVQIIRRAFFLDTRMGFDPEILVRLSWKGLHFRFIGVHVFYPEDGVSNFRMVRDNIGISLMYTRLCFGMVLRLPLLVAQSVRRGRK